MPESPRSSWAQSEPRWGRGTHKECPLSVSLNLAGSLRWRKTCIPQGKALKNNAGTSLPPTSKTQCEQLFEAKPAVVFVLHLPVKPSAPQQQEGQKAGMKQGNRWLGHVLLKLSCPGQSAKLCTFQTFEVQPKETSNDFQSFAETHG